MVKVNYVNELYPLIDQDHWFLRSIGTVWAGQASVLKGLAPWTLCGHHRHTKKLEFTLFVGL